MISVDEKLPNGWVETTLGELINVKHGYAFKGKYISETPNKNILVTPGNFSLGGGFKSDKFKYYHGEIPNDYKLNSNDVIVTMTDLSKEGDTLGFSALVPSNEDKLYLHNQRIGLVIFKNEKFDKQYAYWLLRTRHYQKSMVNSSTGSTVSHTSPSRIQEYNFNLPPLEEQKAIAKVLTAFDDKIENLRAQNQILEQTAQTIFKEWFGKYQIGDELPDGWRVGKLGDIAFNHSKSFKFTEEDVVFVNTGDVSEGQFLHANKVSPIGLPGQAKKAIELYDILYSEIRPKNKRFAFVDFDTSNYVVSTKFMIIRPKDDFGAHILYLLLKNQNTVNEFNVIAESRSGTFPQITFDSISEFPVVIPTKEFQNQFEKILRPLMEKERINHQQIQTLTKTRDALLPKLMRGELRVKNIKTSVS